MLVGPSWSRGSEANLYYQIVGTTVRIAGSIHLVPAGATLPRWVADAYEWSQDLLLEHDASEVWRYAALPDGESLQYRLPPDLWARLLRVWPADHPYGPLARQKPWVVAMYLSASGVPVFLGVEHYVTERARTDERQIMYLETLIEFSALLDGVADGDYQRAYALILDRDARARALAIADIYAAWMRGRADAVVEAMERTPLGQFPAVRQILLDSRNQLWLPRIVNLLGTDRRTVIFVGAAHIGGPGGLLTLLRQARVETQQIA